MLAGTSSYQVSAPHFSAVRYRSIADHVDAVFLAAVDAVPPGLLYYPAER
jgi:hypothetical protein